MPTVVVNPPRNPGDRRQRGRGCGHAAQRVRDGRWWLHRAHADPDARLAWLMRSLP